MRIVNPSCTIYSRWATIVWMLLVVCANAFGQADEFSISNSQIEICGGVLLDTGLNPNEYGPNEDFVMTICPEAPETIVTLYFIIADLGAGDFIQLFDGPDDSANPIGTYDGQSLQGLEIFASEENPGGCITIHFSSDGSENGNFAAVVTCGYPCERPFAVVSSGEPVPHLLVR